MEKHCCNAMQSLLEDKEVPMRYDPVTRYYALTIPKYYSKKNHIHQRVWIEFCPLCGTKLPSTLRDEWIELVKQNFQITKDLKKLPKEFHTDEWWRKRGL